MCFGHFALAIQETLIYAGGGGSGGRGRGPQPPERLCACQVNLRHHFSFTTLLLAAIFFYHPLFFFTTLLPAAIFFYHPPACGPERRRACRARFCFLRFPPPAEIAKNKTNILIAHQ